MVGTIKRGDDSCRRPLHELFCERVEAGVGPQLHHGFGIHPDFFQRMDFDGHDFPARLARTLQWQVLEGHVTTIQEPDEVEIPHRRLALAKQCLYLAAGLLPGQGPGRFNQCLAGQQQAIGGRPHPAVGMDYEQRCDDIAQCQWR